MTEEGIERVAGGVRDAQAMGGDGELGAIAERDSRGEREQIDAQAGRKDSAAEEYFAQRVRGSRVDNSPLRIAAFRAFGRPSPPLPNRVNSESIDANFSQGGSGLLCVESAANRTCEIGGAKGLVENFDIGFQLGIYQD